MNKKQQIKELKEQVKRLQIKLCNGKHEFVKTHKNTYYGRDVHDMCDYNYYQCKVCEVVKIERSPY